MDRHRELAVPVPKEEVLCAHAGGGAVFVVQQHVVMYPYTEGTKVAMVPLDAEMCARYGVKPYQCLVCLQSFTADEVRAFGIAKDVTV